MCGRHILSFLWAVGSGHDISISVNKRNSFIRVVHTIKEELIRSYYDMNRHCWRRFRLGRNWTRVTSLLLDKIFNLSGRTVPLLPTQTGLETSCPAWNQRKFVILPREQSKFHKVWYSLTFSLETQHINLYPASSSVRFLSYIVSYLWF